MRWKWIFTAGAIAGVALAARRRAQKAASESEPWAAVTDPVAPFGGA